MHGCPVSTALLAAGVLATAALTGSAAEAMPETARPAARESPTTNPALNGVGDRPPGPTGDIAFSVPSGTFAGEVTVAMRTSVPRTEIRYTTDGTIPAANSQLYDQPLTFRDSTRLRAQAFTGATPIGAMGTALYLANSVATRHDVPVMVIDVFGAGKPGRDYMDSAVMTFEPSAGTVSPADAPSLVSRAGIHVRGQSSSSTEKTAYRLELRGDNDRDAARPLLGMPEESDWALRAPFYDKSLIRDGLAYGLGAEMSVGAPRFRPCELYLNLDGGGVGPEDYVGVYIVTETVKISKNRLNLARLRKTDLSRPKIEGGYVFKFDFPVARDPILECNGSMKTCWKYLEVVEPNGLLPVQRDWLMRHIQGFHDVLHSEDFRDSDFGYRPWVNLQSFVDLVIISELSRNTDAYMRSAYFSKDRGGKISAGPLWDYDLAWGTGGIRGNMMIEGWQHEEQYWGQRANDWFSIMLRDPSFARDVKERWQTLRGGLLSDAALDQRIDTLAAPLTRAAKRNFDRWPNLTTERIDTWVVTPTADTWRGQVEYTREWLHKRVAWLDGKWL